MTQAKLDFGGYEQGAAHVSQINQAGATHLARGGQSELEILHPHASGDLSYWVGASTPSCTCTASRPQC